MMRYQTFARDELDRALQKHQVLLKAVGNVASTDLLQHCWLFIPDGHRYIIASAFGLVL